MPGEGRVRGALRLGTARLGQGLALPFPSFLVPVLTCRMGILAVIPLLEDFRSEALDG